MPEKIIPDLELPWPDKDLSPNARKNWRAVASAKRTERLGAWATVKSVYGQPWPHPSAQIKFIFHPPNLRARDDDNVIASMKAARDGLADALGIDDAHFKMAYEFGDPRRPFGCVVVQIQGPE